MAANGNVRIVRRNFRFIDPSAKSAARFLPGDTTGNVVGIYFDESLGQKTKTIGR
jgi:hypothetical protein